MSTADPGMLLRRRTKIVATLGPATRGAQAVERLVRAGVNVVRLNMSHGTHEDHAQAYRHVRSASERVGVPVAVLADLSGPKIRVGEFPGGVIDLEDGERVVVTTRDVPGEPGLIPASLSSLGEDLEAGDTILLDDGNLELTVASIDGTEIACEVVHGGRLRDRKGMNFPGAVLSAPALTEKDRVDAAFALELGVDWLALSFVRRAADVEQLRELVQAARADVGIVAKIEKPQALDDLDAILAAADGIMVARGDLGVELPPEDVPVAQDRLVDAARAARKPVIVATQMLESMVSQARPTRAEVSDVSHAVLSGADALMLSAETATGEHPIAAVSMMDRVARRTEGYLWGAGRFASITLDDAVSPPLELTNAVARSTAMLSRDLLVRAIVVVSSTGTSTRVVSAARPAAPVLAVTADPATCRRMALLWGVEPTLVAEDDLQDVETLARTVARDQGLADSGQRLLLVRGFHPDPEQSVPTVTVLTA